MLALPLKGRTAVLFGGCDETARRAEQLLLEGARVKVIWPEIGASVRAFVDRHSGQASFEERAPNAESDMRDAFVSVMVPMNAEVGTPLHAYAEAHQRLFCAIDQPEFCTFYHVAVVRRGPMRFGISSGGSAPGLAKRFREVLEVALTPEFTRFAEHWAQVRESAPRGTRLEATSALLREFFLEIRWASNGSTNRN